MPGGPTRAECGVSLCVPMRRAAPTRALGMPEAVRRRSEFSCSLPALSTGGRWLRSAPSTNKKERGLVLDPRNRPDGRSRPLARSTSWSRCATSGSTNSWRRTSGCIACSMLRQARLDSRCLCDAAPSLEGGNKPWYTSGETSLCVMVARGHLYCRTSAWTSC